MPRRIPPHTADGDGFRFRAGRLCLDLTSTLLWRRMTPIELLRRPDDLARWLAEAGVRRAPLAVTEEELGFAVDLREAVYRLANARIAGRPFRGADVATLNAAARGPAPVPQLAPDGTLDEPGDGTATSHLAAIARDFIALLTGPLAGRLRECAARDCAFLFVDESRPGSRRWCAMNRCGNRHHVREFRARRQAVIRPGAPPSVHSMNIEMEVTD